MSRNSHHIVDIGYTFGRIFYRTAFPHIIVVAIARKLLVKNAFKQTSDATYMLLIYRPLLVPKS